MQAKLKKRQQELSASGDKQKDNSSPDTLASENVTASPDKMANKYFEKKGSAIPDVSSFPPSQQHP